uniref:Sodium/potassium-transporting ATPase subunit beta-1-interacting protein n=1 Tax=Aotus nancymaae TaxID=37293 RepID=A0A2K5EFZ2_AOTNA
AAVWVSWNIFLIFGGLSQVSDSELLTFSLSQHRSWWRGHWLGCLHEEGPPMGNGGGESALGVGHGACRSQASMQQGGRRASGWAWGPDGVCGCCLVSMFSEEEDSCLRK